MPKNDQKSQRKPRARQPIILISDKEEEEALQGTEEQLKLAEKFNKEMGLGLPKIKR